ncbi:MAG: phospholipase D-like domain-containing protein [Bacteriovoracaceae bacterium]
MIKYSIFVSVLIHFLFASISQAKVESFFSPHEGKAGFGQVYKDIKEAKKEVLVTVYSWSAHELDKALTKAIENGADVRVVLHSPLAKKQKIKDRVKPLEELGVRFKISSKNMHEKFVIVDGEMVMNTSGNFSYGAQNRYSENLVFHYDDGEAHIKHLIKEFKEEFEVLWNYSKSFNTDNDYLNTVSQLKKVENKIQNEFSYSNLNTFASSSMNFGASAKSRSNGSELSLKIKRGKPWAVRDMVIDQIRKAKKSIHLCLNHFFIKEIVDEIMIAMKERNVEVKFAVDNQEYKYYTSRTKEATPYFVHLFKKAYPNKEIPVRIKFYSLAPSYHYWLLNHHKFMIIDYGTEEQKLINGSYNFSKTAEHNQFDNLVLYEGVEYAELIEDFMGEFENLWGLNRKRGDKLDQDYMDYFTKPNSSGFFPLHNFKSAQSVTWDELVKWKKSYSSKTKVSGSVAPSQKKHCKGVRAVRSGNRYNKVYSGCPAAR